MRNRCSEEKEIEKGKKNGKTDTGRDREQVKKNQIVCVPAPELDFIV